MSEKDALKFISQVREGTLKLPPIDPYTQTLEDMARQASQLGLEFTVDELRSAFKRHWGEQWLRFKQRL